MTALSGRKCRPCEGGVSPMEPAAARALLDQLNHGWQLDTDSRLIRREYHFRNFHQTMSFVNAIAYIANTEDHHPDLELGYDYCRVTFTTHAIAGLSENDFICAAKIDALTGI